MKDAAALFCIFSLLLILGGGVVIMLYGVRGAVALVREWIDNK